MFYLRKEVMMMRDARFFEVTLVGFWKIR